MAYFFNNKLYVEPGADVIINLDGKPTVAALSTSTCLVLGESDCGLSYKDKKMYKFASISDAAKTLKGGTALDAISCIFNPSPNASIKGASTVFFVRTNEGFPAEFKFSSSTELMTDKIEFTVIPSKQAGGIIGFTFELKGVLKKKLVSSISTSLEASIKELADELNKIKEIDATPAATSLTVKARYSGTEFAITDLIQNDTLTNVLTHPKAFAPQFKSTKVITKEKGSTLDYSIKSSNGTISFYKETSLIGVAEGVTTAKSLKEVVESSTLLNRLFEVVVENEGEVLPSSNAIIHLQNKENVATTVKSFSDALSLVSSLNRAVTFAAFEDEKYHLLLKAHLNNQAEFGSVGFVGGSLNESPAKVSVRALNLNTETISLCYPGVYLNLGDETKLYSPMYFAAICAGLACGLPPQIPLTRKTVNVLGFEDFDLGGDSAKLVRESLINNGVLVGRYLEDTGYIINKGINTIQGQNGRKLLGTDNSTHEISIARIRLQIQKEFRVSADRTFPGTNRLHPSKAQVEQFAANYFNSIVGTYLTGWKDSTLNVTLDEDAWLVSAELYVNGPVNHFFATLTLALSNNL